MINCPSCEFADFEKDKCARLLTRLPHVCPYAEERKPRNHFEAIKAMSMEEMAAFFENIAQDWGQAGASILIGNSSVYVDDWLEWLKEAIE